MSQTIGNPVPYRTLLAARPSYRFAICAILCFCPSVARGQLAFVDKVFGNVSDINASRLWGKTYGRRGIIADSSLVGFGIEVTLDAGHLVPRSSKKCGTTAEAERRHSKSGDSTRTRDSTVQEIRVRYPRQDNGDSTIVFTVKPHKCTEHSWVDAELGFGYSQLQGIRGDTLGLQGAIEELPAISLYAIINPEGWVQPYIGVRGGLAQLKGFRVTGGSSFITATGSTFQYGGLIGLALGEPKKWSVFVEVAWTSREFDGVAWSAAVPPAFQEPLRLSTRTIALGGQIEFVQAK